MATPQVKIGIIGGSGLDNPDLLENRKEKYVTTPYGEPSDALITGTIQDVQCVLLARHGRAHDKMPTDVNFRANVWALKEEGCTHIVATTACGSLQEEYSPGDIVFLDQFLDKTTKRDQSFYDGKPNSPKGVCHIPMASPFCEETRKILIQSVKDLGFRYHATGTNITVEGPRFGSRAESKLHKSWGAHIVNMTTVPEVVLANEAGLSYSSIALVTDYDCWREEDEVNVAKVMETMKGNSKRALKLLLRAIPKIAEKDWTETRKQLQSMVQMSIML